MRKDAVGADRGKAPARSESPRPARRRVPVALLALGAVLAADAAAAQEIARLIVDVRTRDVRFAGTDDGVHLQIGGRDFTLDDPDRDDFERGNVDHFEFDLSHDPLSIELIRGIGQISVTKIEDSFFGGGWAFGGLTISAQPAPLEPLFSNDSINVWLDGDDLEFTTTLGDPGWNVPEPPPFPPCNTPGDIDTGAGATFDADCDGIPDGEDPTFDTPPDSDGDGLPDLFETQTGSDPADTDSDDDGWADGRNRRSHLVLTRIQCDDENEDVGSDELYLNAEDVRYPAAFDLDGYWAMNDGTVRSPGVVIDVRMLPAGAPAAFSTRLRLRESDFKIFERPTDDTYATFELEWNEDGTSTFTHDGNDAHYVLTFRWFTIDRRDPDPLQSADFDQDSFDERTEARLSVQDPAVQPVRIDGHDGLADPARREIWVEVDASGSDQRLKFDAKQMVASQFAYHDIAPRFDDGWFGGGQVHPYVETLTPTDLAAFRNDDAKFSPQRRALGHFRYALLGDDLEDAAGSFGHASFTCPPCNLMIGSVPLLGHTLTSQAQPIFLMHETGHTLGLCHRPGDRPQTSSACPVAAGTNPLCDHYCGVDEDSTTAMGSETAGDTAGSLVGSTLAGVGAGIVIGGLIGGLFGPKGAIVGAIIGGIVGGIIGAVVGVVAFSDFYDREVNYDLIEWQVLRL